MPRYRGDVVSDAAILPILSKTGTAAAATAVTVTVPAAPTGQHTLRYLAISASGAASGPATVTVKDGTTDVFVLDVNVAIATPLLIEMPGAGIEGTVNKALSVVVSAGASGSITKLNVGYFTS